MDTEIPLIDAKQRASERAAPLLRLRLTDMMPPVGR